MSPKVDKRHLLAVLLYIRMRRRTKQWWIHPLLKERYLTGAFYVLYDKFRQDDKSFFNYFRMSTSTFDELLCRLVDTIKRQDTNMRLCIPPTEMLTVTIRYLASGNTFTDMHYTYKLGIKTISRIVSLVCCKIWDTLSGEQLAFPTTEKWKSIANGFMHTANFPNCLGAIDGKHIRVEHFPQSGSMNLNYKGYFSFVLLAIVDSEYKFVFVDIGSYGKDCDSAILQRTTFYELLTADKLNLPTPGLLHASSNTRMPYVFVGDEAFALTHNLLRPYSGKNLDVTKRIFNYRLCRARRYIECAFGILTNKWRIFHRALNVSKTLSKNIVKACIVLHNIIRERDGYRYEDLFVPSSHSQLQALPHATRQGGRTANDVRNTFADYFVSPEGALPWQMAKI